MRKSAGRSGFATFFAPVYSRSMGKDGGPGLGEGIRRRDPFYPGERGLSSDLEVLKIRLAAFIQILALPWQSLPKILMGPVFRWIGTRRGEASAIFAGIALLDFIFFAKAQPLDLLAPRSSPMFWVFWPIFIFGTAMRLWAAGVINKNSEVTCRGIYRMVRHPLYVGTLLIYSSFFLILNNLFLGLVLILLMTLLIYYPRMLHEEELLLSIFPHEYRKYMNATPRMIPKLSLPWNALGEGAFSVRRGYENLRMKCLWGIILMPILYEGLVKLISR